jgi:hypothetical protein
MNVARDLIADAIVRGGSYGDPAAVPFHIWQALQHSMQSGTAYTHAWRAFPELASFCMASVDTAEERIQAKMLGFRTFRVRGIADPVEFGNNMSRVQEANYKTTAILPRVRRQTRKAKS